VAIQLDQRIPRSGNWEVAEPSRLYSQRRDAAATLKTILNSALFAADPMRSYGAMMQWNTNHFNFFSFTSYAATRWISAQKPCGVRFEKCTSPPQASTLLRTIARPRPTPPVSRVRAISGR